MTSPDDQLDGILSQIAAQDQVDPAVFEQTLEAAFDHAGSGFDELIPETENTLPDDTDSTYDDEFVADVIDDHGDDDHSEPDDDTDDNPHDVDYSHLPSDHHDLS